MDQKIKAQRVFRNLLKLSGRAKTHIQGRVHYLKTWIQGHQSAWESQTRSSSKYPELRRRLQKGPFSRRHLRGLPVIRPELGDLAPAQGPAARGRCSNCPFPGSVRCLGRCGQAQQRAAFRQLLSWLPLPLAPSFTPASRHRASPPNWPGGQASDLPSLLAIPESIALCGSGNRSRSPSLGSSG